MTSPVQQFTGKKYFVSAYDTPKKWYLNKI